MAPPRITSFLVKVASRCNLDCDYCYVYHHADQSWRSMPRLLSADDREAFARRLADYAREVDLTRCVVVLHGGEPLLAGAEEIANFVARLRANIRPETELDVGLQTNGLLLTDKVLDILEAAGVSVSLSLDGPREVNDLHRNSRKRRSSFDRVLGALERLKRRPKVFAGVIAVVDPAARPGDLFAFFDAHQPPKLDFLLPDAHHLRPPPGRADIPDVYRDWLVEAFDLWFDHYPHLPVRTFEALLDAAAGLPSGTDAFGLGDVSLISIETDGTYHDLDVLKVVGAGATQLAGSVNDTPIAEVAASAALAAHRTLLSKPGLSAACQACPVVEICGGGSLPHRFGTDGFNQPSVYCGELFALIGHVQKRLVDGLAAAAPPRRDLPSNIDLARYELAETAAPAMALLRADAQDQACATLREALGTAAAEGGEHAAMARSLLHLPSEAFGALANEPGSAAWARAYIAGSHGRIIHDMAGRPLPADSAYLERLVQNVSERMPGLAVAQDDPWLRAPFGEGIAFESEETAETARHLVARALEIVRAWRPALAEEMALACRAIQFVRDPTAHPDKIVSFSDNSVPGALYVSVTQGGRLIDPHDLADSLIHEHRHQKLYLLERFGPMTQTSTALVVSPWREDMRPPSGLLHAIFVFVELRRFWIHVRDAGDRRLRVRAINQLADTDRHLAEAFNTLRDCDLTATGKALAAVLEAASASKLIAA